MTTAHDPSLIYSGVYDPWLVGLSVLTAILASYGALRVSQGIQSAGEPLVRLGLLAVGAVALGGGIWAMHFIGMLAFSLPCGVHYDLETTLVSIVPGVLAGGVALMVISRRQATRGTIAFGAILLGAGIGAMHYTGMAAMRLGAELRYDPVLFAVSIVVAVLLAMLALTMKFRARPRLTDASVLPDLLTAMVMGAAISGMHYTAMAAAYFVHDGASALPVSGLDPTILALVIVVVSALLIGVSMLGAVATRTRSLALSLVAANESLGRISRTFENTLNSAGDGIFGLDRDGRITFVNPVAVEMLGWSRDELIGADAHTMVHHSRPDGSPHSAADCPVTAVLRNGHIHHSLNDVYWRRDGSSFAIEVTVAPVVAEGEISGAVVIFRDDSQRQRSEYERLLASRVVES
ncbi:MAG: MHYT domain-containing protein, partial [Rhodospirillaceae bacterium]